MLPWRDDGDGGPMISRKDPKRPFRMVIKLRKVKKASVPLAN